ncbi:YtoQ family protein [Arcobacter sp. HD9-500m-PIT-SAG02]|nr:YtoQ family protein [Arcobacter sp. HD9-500m-PIT-SAG02]
MRYNVYLSGEIHTSWRNEIIQGCKELNLDIEFGSPVTVHKDSDAAGDCLRAQDIDYNRDHQSAKVNAIRTKTLINNAHIVVVRFGDQYKQWNAAFDAGYCAAINKPYITLHDEAITHALKEVDSSAQAWATTPQQVTELLRYTLRA